MAPVLCSTGPIGGICVNVDFIGSTGRLDARGNTICPFLIALLEPRLLAKGVEARPSCQRPRSQRPSCHRSSILHTAIKAARIDFHTCLMKTAATCLTLAAARIKHISSDINSLHLMPASLRVAAIKSADEGLRQMAMRDSDSRGLWLHLFWSARVTATCWNV